MAARLSTVIALGLGVAGCGGNPTEAAAPQTGKNRKPTTTTTRPAATSVPSPRNGYFIPPEWAGSGRDDSSPQFEYIVQAQSIAIYLYQHPEAFSRLAIQREIVGMYSCGDADTEHDNEVRAPEIRARYVAKMRSWLASAKPEGKAEFQIDFHQYDPARQSFGYRGADFTGLRDMGSGAGNCDNAAGGYSGEEFPSYDHNITITGARLPRVTVSPAVADRIIQTSGGSHESGQPIKVTAYFTIPKSPAPGTDPNNGSVLLARADFSNDALKNRPGEVFATYRP